MAVSDKIRFLLFPLPLVILFSAVFKLHMIVGDYATHLAYQGGGGYPSGLAFLLSLLQNVIPRDVALFGISILCVIYLPYVLVFHITKSLDASWMYLYGSGVPLILGFIWFVPQSMIHVLMLLSVISWWALIPFLFLGAQIHSVWMLAFAVVVGYKLFWRRS